MSSFTDTQERKWTLEINVSSVRDVKRTLGVDLTHLFDEHCQPLAELLGDPLQLVDVLYVLCQQQAKARGVTDEDFGRGMGGDTLEQAAEAFTEALTDFFPSRRRKLLKTVVDKARAVGAKMEAIMQAKADNLDPAALAEQLGGSSGNARESSDLTRALTPSANSSG